MPTTALAALSNGLTKKGMSQASKLSMETARSQRLDGVVEVETTDGGRSSTTLVNTKSTIKSAIEIAGAALGTYQLAQTLSNGGQAPYDPGSLAPGTDTSPEAIASMGSDLQSEVGDSSDTASIALQLQQQEANQNIAKLNAELKETHQQLENVNQVLAKRASGELPDPQLNFSGVTAATESILEDLRSTGAFTDEEMEAIESTIRAATDVDMENFETYVVNNLVTPFVENFAAFNARAAQLTGAREATPIDDPIFTTVFGPPVSTSGKFLLSDDGIYYDSRSGSIPYITAERITAKSWELRYSSNRGGKGSLYDGHNKDRFADTILSYEYKNETGAVRDFYKYDTILTNLYNDRDLQVQDVSGKVADLIASGYAASSAIVKNYRESYASIGFAYENKIKKRKKQLQVAALFGPYGVTTSASPEGEGLFFRLDNPDSIRMEQAPCGNEQAATVLSYETALSGGITVSGGDVSATYVKTFIPEIPLNDFSYLKDIGLLPTVQSQKEAMLQSSDMDDTTNPIPPTYLSQGPGTNIQAIPERALAYEGTTDWVNTSGDTALTGTTAYLRTLDSSIVTDNLVVCYNFLEPSAVGAPSSSNYGVRNYGNPGYSLNAKLVGGSASSVFTSGVSIPYLTGTTYNITNKYGTRYSWLDASTGSYVRLPNNYMNDKLNLASEPLDNLMYNDSGWSIEFWAHMPGLSSTLTPAHRYKLVAANENCGDPVTNYSNSTITTVASYGGTGIRADRRTRGMIIGWRDRGAPGTANASGLEFAVLPTVAQNDERWGKSVCIAESVSGNGPSTCVTELGFKVGISTSSLSGYTIGDASSSFAHHVVTCDLNTDTITMYVNGQFVASANVSTAFDIESGFPLNIPTAIAEGAYQDTSERYGERLFRGSLNGKPPIFTPWILGGGFTDNVGHESPPIFSSTFPGFLGTNTNDSYFRSAMEASGGPVGQHSVLATNTPGLGGYNPTGANYLLARSGLNGHLGSFKMYSKPLSTKEVLVNYNAQNPFFSGISTPFRLL